MTKLEQIVQEIRTSIVNTAEQAEERIESLRKKYGDLDLKDYRVRAYAHGRTLIFDIDEKDLPRFIRDFRVHFGHKGEVSSVWHSWEKTFSVTYRFDEDFEASFYTTTPEKYILRGSLGGLRLIIKKPPKGG